MADHKGSPAPIVPPPGNPPPSPDPSPDGGPPPGGGKHGK